MEPEGSVPRYSRAWLFFYAHFTEVTDIRKLKKYTPTPFMAKGSHYDKALADYAVSFIQCLCHTKGTWARKPFELIDWQEQIIRDVFGIVDEKGNRQFRTAYVEIGKKNGKSELAAAVALYLLFADNEPSTEVYGTANGARRSTAAQQTGSRHPSSLMLPIRWCR